MESKNRLSYYGLDIVKFIAACFVIAGHTHPLSGLEGTALYKYYFFILSLIIPFFAMTSGFLLCQKLTWSEDSTGDIKILKKALFSQIRMYLIWSLIHLPFAFIEPVPADKPLYMIVARYIINFFFVGEQYLSWQFWYLLASIYGLALILGMRKLNFRPWHMVLSFVALFFISVWMYRFISWPDSYSGVVRILSQILSEVFLSGRLFYAIACVVAGVTLARIRPDVNPILLLIILVSGFLLYFFEVPIPAFLSPNAIYFPCGLCLFLICSRWKGTKPSTFCRNCRVASIVYYCTHMLWFYVGYTLRDFIPGISYQGFPIFLFTFLTCSITAVFVVRFQRTKLVKLLF